MGRCLVGIFGGFILVGWFLLSITTTNAAIIPVTDPSVGIKAALAIAVPGDVLQIHSGIYTGPQNCDLQIQTQNLTLLGLDGAENTVVDCNHTSRCLSVLGVTVNIVGLQLRNGRASNTPTTTTTRQSIHSNNQDTSKRMLLLPAKRRKDVKFIFAVRVFLASDGSLKSKFKLSSHSGSEAVNTETRSSSSSHEIQLRASQHQRIGIQVGGCVFVMGGASVVLSNVIISGGQASRGCGIGVTDSSINIIGTRIEGNGVKISTNDNLFGGGGYFFNSSVMVLNCSFSNNFLQTSGTGGLFGGGLSFVISSNVVFQGPITISNCGLFSTNSSGNPFLNGGGIYCYSSNNASFQGSITISNCSLSSTNSSGAGILDGGGLFFLDSNNALFQGPVTISNCSLLVSMNSNGNGILDGGGMHFLSSYNASFQGSLTISNCSLISNGNAMMLGGGLYCVNADGFVAKSLLVSNNRIVGSQHPLFQHGPYHSNNVCQGFVAVSDTFGKITDGSYPNPYANGMDCSWAVASNDNFNQAFGSMQVKFSRFDVYNSAGCQIDYVSVFDGPTSSFPLIGTYCGSLGSIVSCNAGQCPSLQNGFNVSGPAFYVQFHTNSRPQIVYPVGTGFVLEWSMHPSQNRLSGSSGLMPLSTQIQSYGAGGGIYFESTTNVILSNAIVANNAVVHPLFAFGGGLAISVATTDIVVSNSSLSNNRVSAFIAGGGGVVAFQYSVLTAISSNFTSNQAIASSSSCFNTYDSTIQCPASFGGGMASVASQINAEGCNMDSNTASCDPQSPQCTAQGGAMAVTRNGTANITTRSRCSNNAVSCESSNCIGGFGGCVYGDSYGGKISDTIIENNTANVGGGIFGVGSFALNISDSTIQYNIAQRQGGGIQLGDSAIFNVDTTNFESNNGGSLGGAISTSALSSISVSNSSFKNNVAQTASVGMAIGKSTILQNNNVAGESGIFAVVIGNRNFTGLEYQCNNQGSFFQGDREDNYYSLACSTCSSGSYLGLSGSSIVNVTKCYDCPSKGAVCLGSDNNDLFGLRSLPNFWGTVDPYSGKAVFYPCPDGYCCDQEYCDYNYCDGNRTGFLCGSCAPNHSMQFFSDHCAPNAECNHARWFIPVLYIVFIAIVGVNVAFSDFSSDGTISTLIYFYQATPLAMSAGSAKSVIAPILSFMQTVFNLSPQGNGSIGLCLFPNMTTRTKLSLEIGCYGLLLAACPAVLGIHAVIQKLKHEKLQKWIEDNPPTTSTYLAIVAKIVMFSFITVTVNTLSMLQCFSVDGSNVQRWFLDGEIECLQDWQQAAIAMAVLLCLFPFAIAGAALKWGHGHGLGSIQTKIRTLLVSPYKMRRWWWCGVSMGRRLLISIAFTWTWTNGWRSAAMFVLCSVFLGMQMWVKPFSSTDAERNESISLGIMCILVALSSRRLAFEQFGLYSDEFGIEWVQLVLFLIPGLLVLWGYYRMVRNYWMKWKKKKRAIEMGMGMVLIDGGNG